VSPVSRWYQRFRRPIHEFAKFAMVGATGFLVTDGAFNLMISEHQATFIANAVATLAATAVTFAGSRYWTFRHRERSGLRRETAIFIVLNLVGVLIQQACIEFARHELAAGLDKVTLNAAFLVGVGLATLFRFWSYRTFVWLPHLAGPATGPDVRRTTASGPMPSWQEELEPDMVPPAPLRPEPSRS
jgi:putative flippase GtrA